MYVFARIAALTAIAVLATTPTAWPQNVSPPAAAVTSAGPIAISADGIHVATVTADNTIVVRERNLPADAPPTAVFTDVGDHVLALAFSTGGSVLAAASDDRKLRLWQISTGKKISELKEPREPKQVDENAVSLSHVTAIAFDPAGTRIAFVDPGLHWLVMYPGDRLSDLDQLDAISVVTPSPLYAITSDRQSGWIAGDGGGRFHFYNAVLRETSVTPAKVLGAVRSIDVSPDTMFVATGGDDQEVKIWSLSAAASGAPFSSVNHFSASGAVAALAFRADGRSISIKDSAARLTSWSFTESMPASAAKPPVIAAVNPPPVTLPVAAPVVVPPPVTPAAAPPVKPPPVTAQPVTPPPTVPPAAPPVTPPPTAPPVVPPATPPATTLPPVVPPPPVAPPVEQPKPPVQVASASPVPPPFSTSYVHVTQAHLLTGHTDYVNTVGFSPDGTLLASGSRDKTVHLWNAAAGTSERIVGRHDKYVSSVVFSPDGKTLASGGWDNKIKLWNVHSSGEENSGVFSGHTSYVLSLAYNHEGTFLTSGSNDRTARVWQIGGSAAPPRISAGEPDAIAAVAFSPNGQFVAGGCLDGRIYIWNAKTMQLVHKLAAAPLHAIFCLTFLDNETIVSGGPGGFVRLWTIPTEKLSATLTAEGRDVFSVAYEPRRRLLAAGGADKYITLWHLADLDAPRENPGLVMKPLLRISGHTNTVRSVAFSADGSMMASGGWDNNVILWRVESGGVASAASEQQVATRR